MAMSLKLVDERRVRDLFADNPPQGALEASGVLAMDGKFFVVFDNRTDVARLSADLQPGHMNGLFGMARGRAGFEGISYNGLAHRFYLLIESRKTRKGKYRPEVFEYSDALDYVTHRAIDFTFKSENKGFEALAHIQRDNKSYLLALCEGNRCKRGRKGRTPGGGRIQLFKEKRRKWSPIGTIELPNSVQFRDYSAMALDGDRVAIVSQEDSMLWIGVFQEHIWRWKDAGKTYLFPRTDDNGIQYGNVEGVSWITDHRIVVVSDRRKKSQPDITAEKDQSIHIFDIPG